MHILNEPLGGSEWQDCGNQAFLKSCKSEGKTTVHTVKLLRKPFLAVTKQLYEWFCPSTMFIIAGSLKVI